jgi:peptidoglycan/LPS O-acetylase OafA/YrhL
MAGPGEPSGLHDRDIARVELPGLTPLRGIAALVVVLYHSSFLTYHYGAGGVPAVWARGYLAVDLFFFLSGFVLNHVYWHRFSRDRNWRAVGAFLWARFCRIYPACSFVTIVYALTYSVGSLTFPIPVAFVPQLTASLLLLQVPWLQDVWINGPSWSISAEWYAYLVFPFLASAALGVRRSAASAVMAALLIGVGLEHAMVDPDWQVTGWLALLRALPEFAVGVFAYRAYRDEFLCELWQKDLTLAAIVAAILAAAATGMSDGILVILLLALLLAAVSNSGRIAGILNLRLLRWLGEISYSVYIFQMVVFMLVVRFAPVLVMHGVRGVWFEAIAAVAAVAGGVLVHRRVDVPARTALRRLPERLAALAAARRSIRVNAFLR